MRKVITFIGNILFSFKKREVIENPKKILIIRSGGIGDVLMSTPMISAIKEKYPNSHISFLVGKWSRAALENNPNIDSIIEFDDDIIFKKRVNEILKLISQIKKEKFDLAIILDKAWEWNFISFLFGIKSRIGFDRCKEGFANNINVTYSGEKYELEYYLDIARTLGCQIKSRKIEIYSSANDRKTANELLKKSGLTGKIIGIACGGASNPGQDFAEKRWPAEKYIELIKNLAGKYDIILFGGKNDKEISGHIYENTKNEASIIDFCGELTVQQSAVLISQCGYFITHDSGPMHIAAATQTRIIALFGPTPAKRFAPANVNTKIVESKKNGCPCYDIFGKYDKNIAKDCMNEISVEDVLSKIEK